uniref:Ankyrin repeat and SOCS box containing 13a, tandem duplicate 1 n=1 Tax=Cyprinodon variegatus TaxID=28743 RepID=A0A3Q2CAZ7_CYPVA
GSAQSAMEVTAARRSFLCDIGSWADRTALHEAAAHGRALQLKQLLEEGAPVNVVTVDNITPLHEACIQAHPNCARLLLEAGAQVTGSAPVLLEAWNETYTGIRHSVMIVFLPGNADVVRLMITNGAKLEAFDIHFGPPLHIACAKGRLDCVKELLKAGADVNSVKFHETALHHAARANMVDMMELLVEFGADVFASDNLGRKPIDYTDPASPSYSCLQFYESNPLNLQQLCRIALRRMLGTKASEVMEQLKISHRIYNYLQFSDLL